MSESTALAPRPTVAEVGRSLPEWAVHAVTLGIVVICLSLGFNFWANWFTSIDRIVCTICIALGLIISLTNGWWNSDTKSRFFAPCALWLCALLFLGVAVATGRPKFFAIAVGFAFAGWFAAQMKGESVGNAIALGMAFMVPALVEAFKERQFFDMIASNAVGVTSGLADVFGQSHFREGNSLYFAHGVANQFSCVGKWDSIVTFLGISLFCIYTFRRSLLGGIATVSLAFFVWIAVRATAWVILSAIASFNQQIGESANVTEMNWTWLLEVSLFVIGALLIFSLDQLFGSLLAPIPVEFINPDFPLVALFWNFIVGLPSLTPEVPSRSLDVEDFVEDDSR